MMVISADSLLFTGIVVQLVAVVASQIQWISDQTAISLRKPKDGSLTRGGDVTLKCLVDGFPEPEVSWYRNHIRIYTTETSYTVISPNRLRIHSLTADAHNGVYTCSAENTGGTAAMGTSGYFLSLAAATACGEHSYCPVIVVSDTAEPNAPYLSDELFTKYTVTLPGRDVWLDCMFSDAASTRWYKGVESQIPVVNSTRLRTIVYPNGTLFIRSVQRFDEGTYVCEGQSSDGNTQSFTAELNIARLGRFNGDNLEPSVNLSMPIVLSKGQEFELNCLRPQGRPTPSVQWIYKSSGLPIQNGPHINIIGSKLHIDEANVTHTNVYTCVAENMAGVRELRVEIVVTVAPRITKGPENITLEEGTFVQLPCSYIGSRPPWTNVTWLFNGQPLHIKYNMMVGQEMTVDHTTGTLTISRVKSSMGGVYSCIVYTQKQQPVGSQAAVLNVTRTLKFYPAPRSRIFELGTNDSVACHAVAEAKPSIFWYWLVDEDTKAMLPPSVSSNSGVLTFTNIQKSVSGNYMCVARVDTSPHSFNSINTTISIGVGVSPSITYSSDNQTAKVGDSAILHCKASGDPDPYVKWDQAGTILDMNSTSHIQQLKNNSLLISSVELKDQAIYGCIVGNIRGFKRVAIGLTVVSNSSLDYQPYDTIGEEHPEESAERLGIGMTKTIVIAVSASVAYLILVIGLITYCGLRRVRRKRQNHLTKKVNLQLHQMSGTDLVTETDRLMSEATPSTQPISSANQLTESVKCSTSISDYTAHEIPSSPPNGHAVVVRRDGPAASNPKGYDSADSSVSKGSTHMLKYDRTMLVNIGVLGNGIYGDVFLAKAAGLTRSTSVAAERQTELVCVKRLSNRDETVRAEFKHEMDMFHKLRHDRICRLLAVCKETEPIYMVMEYCEWGDLKQFLLATNGCNNGQELTIDPPTLTQKLKICHQVADAMNYLATKRFVHKDLASRNILLEPNLNVKISSLGLSKDIYASEYVQHKSGLLISLRWTSPEAWLEDDYSTKSDVWSFGCVLFEVFSGGDIPYSDQTNEQVMKGYETGCLLPLTGHCMPQSMQTIAYQCWSTCLNDRPDFSQILTMYSSSASHSNNVL